MVSNAIHIDIKNSLVDLESIEISTKHNGNLYSCDLVAMKS